MVTESTCKSQPVSGCISMMLGCFAGAGHAVLHVAEHDVLHVAEHAVLHAAAGNAARASGAAAAVLLPAGAGSTIFSFRLDVF